MLDDIDLVLLDVKSGDPDTYRRVTSRELEPTLAFGRRLAARTDGPEVWIRFVLVPGPHRRRPRTSSASRSTPPSSMRSDPE